ncbi:1-acyl-sn-glycerol-3-phosphate acyltransferase [Aquimarina sp. 2201CG14-23]|uniref:1-acyl-sn-glycerol-3-phosphate acyltransferase n=1 Tax=Aquimarina mycalae TaxID=3040073 RepID=UPI00247826B0|nr:1-acyl-sn-glycerol-3-phosphate acyltransferase [Aquimarina sp. 2201CG14-23]MDH7446728.1 1-acyl-sn-glycerol-3-phosphate acyltransferase [Aquimarina sp. 2201CG14-23]
MHNFFLSVYQFIKQNKLIAWPIIIGVFAVFAFLASSIGFEEDITRLIPNSDKSEITQKVLKTVSFSDKIVVNIRNKGENPDDLTAYASAYIDSLNKHLPQYIKKIQGKVADDNVMQLYDFVYKHLPFFLTESDYRDIDHKINPDSISKIIENNYKSLISPAGLVTKKYIVKDPLALTPKGLQKLAQLQLGDNYDLYNGFLITKDRKNLLLFLTPALATNETGENTIFVEGLKKITSELNSKYASNAEATLFGATLYAVANAKQIKGDIQLTVSIAMSILLLILIFFYRKLAVPLIIFTPTVFGAIVAIAMLYLIKGKISAISLGIGSVLLGITLDYSLHILTHFRNNNNVKELYRDVSMPVLMSSLTTAVAFLCLVFVKSEALNDLGIFAAISVVSASIFALVFIPQVYRFSEHKKAKRRTFIDKISQTDFHKNKILISIITVVFIIALFLFHKVGFNTDLNTMNYQPEELVAAEVDLDRINNNKAKSIYLVSYGTSLNEALNANNRLFETLDQKKSNNELINFSSVGGVVLSQEAQKEKIKLWNEFWTDQRKDSITNLLKQKGSLIGFKPETFTQFYNALNVEVSPIGFNTYKQIKELYLDEFVTDQENFATVVSAIKVDHEDADNINASLSKIPNTVVIDRKQLNETLLGNLKNDFNSLIGYSLIAVVLLLLIFYRDPMLTLLTALPIAITWVITLGVMKILGIDFNIFNVIISTFIFGLGVDYSIFITNGLVKEFTYGVKELSTYKTSILLSVITTILGVGVLIFAKHPALRSISTVSLIGILSAVLVAFTIQPMLFRLFITNRVKKGLTPLRIRQTLWSIFSFGYFIIGGFLVSIMSSLIIPWFPVSKKKKMGVFHKITSRLMGSVLYSNPFVKKRVYNPEQEDFSKQCIIIANHSSFLDIISIGMLYPKLIYLVKDWVYDNPVFGRAAKLAGFYPVSSGIEGGVEHLREKVKQGYSLIAFPEGSRTETAKMSRFHKGSFYLAQELNLDILPVVIHGNAQVSPKGDFIIHDGAVQLKILPRITVNNKEFGNGYAERTKKISTYFREQYSDLQKDLEGVDYYKKALLNNYRYKSCYSDIKNDFKINKEKYYKAASYIEHKNNVLQYSDDYGQFLLYLSFKKPYTKLKGILTESEKLLVAQNCYTTIRNKVGFVSNMDLTSTKFDVLLLNTTTPIQPQYIKELVSEDIKRIIIFSGHNEFPDAIKTTFKVDVQEFGLTVLNRIS